jgi:hypothetical protein
MRRIITTTNVVEALFIEEIRKATLPDIELLTDVYFDIELGDFPADGYLLILREVKDGDHEFIDKINRIILITKTSKKPLVIITIGSVTALNKLITVPINALLVNASAQDVAIEISNSFKKQFKQTEKNTKEVVGYNENSWNKLLEMLFRVKEHEYEKLTLTLKKKIDTFIEYTSKNSASPTDGLHRDLELLLDQIEKSTSNQLGYFLLKVNPDTWPIPLLQTGYIARFHTHDLQNQRRVDYELFHKLKIGDQIIGFAFHQFMAVVCEFEVIEEIGNDGKLGEGIGLKVVREVKPHIPLELFKQNIEDPKVLYNDNPYRLFNLEEKTYKAILKASRQNREPMNDRELIPEFTNDTNPDQAIDQLGFQHDVDSFAAMIALRTVTPPLAIGLFGAWGSGKSFFMKKLSERIIDYTKKESDRFIKHVVQVKFNAWHYSDSNLWASLITHIFEELNNYATNKKFDQESVKEMYEQMDLASIAITETSKKVQDTDQDIKELEQKQEKLKEIIEQKKSSLEMLKSRDILGVIFNEPTIQGMIKLISKTDPAQDAITNIEDIGTRYLELNSFWKRLIEAFTMLREQKGNWWKVWLMALTITCLPILFIFYPTMELLNKCITIILSSLGSITVFVKSYDWLKPHLRTAKKAFVKIKSLKNAIESRAEHFKYFEQEEIDRLQEDIRSGKAQKENFDKLLEEKQTVFKKLEHQITQIGSGKMISTFISGKSGEDGYHDELGIISRIRKDFTQLNHLFMQQKGVKGDQSLDKERFQIDRIILYIDDLDRCSSEIVVKTLEAIHLLLAFELFVVVVGVDSRWLNHALDEKYVNFLETDKKQMAKQDKETITSYDYLEKIFQIPFALKSVTQSSKNKLIAHLTASEIIQQNPDNQKNGKLNTIAYDNNELMTDIEKNSHVHNEQVAISDELIIEIEEKITFFQEEIETMQRLSYMIGDSPRAIKRYINIYRLVKAHKSYIIYSDPSKMDYIPAMLLLAIIVGSPRYANNFIISLIENNDTTMKEFVDKLSDSPVKKHLEALPQDISLGLNTTMLKEHVELISRFSFRAHQQKVNEH